MKLETKDLLTGDEISSKEFLELIDFSIKLKKETKMAKKIRKWVADGRPKQIIYLRNKT